MTGINKYQEESLSSTVRRTTKPGKMADAIRFLFANKQLQVKSHRNGKMEWLRRQVVYCLLGAFKLAPAGGGGLMTVASIFNDITEGGFPKQVLRYERGCRLYFKSSVEYSAAVAMMMI